MVASMRLLLAESLFPKRLERHAVDQPRGDELHPLADLAEPGHDELAPPRRHRLDDLARALPDRHAVALVQAAPAGGLAIGAVAVDADAGEDHARIDRGHADP